MKRTLHNTAFTCSRRAFFTALLQEIGVLYNAAKGKPGYRLSDIPELGETELARLMPIVNPEHEIFIEEAYVWSRHKETGTTLKLFPVEPENLATFNRFNGRYTLGEISAYLAQEMDWDQARAFAHVRELFIALVERFVCLPKEPLA